ncbi:MAG: tRNA (adenosine(37)-N6)-threonylcarbamoyltransferase complex ATPase subunit type 1 TsaE [Verrucomicrobiota bacterium]
MSFPQEPVFLKNAEATFRLGRQIADQLNYGMVIALIGDLGSGKTHLSKGLVAGLGSDEEVTSPTFNLVHEYVNGRIPVFHFDFFRLESEVEVIQLGWDDYLDEEGLVVVEWADRFPTLLPAHRTRWWTFDRPSENERVLTASVRMP